MTIYRIKQIVFVVIFMTSFQLLDMCPLLANPKRISQDINKAVELKAKGQVAKAADLLERSPAKNDPIGMFNLACYKSLLQLHQESALYIKKLVDLITSNRVPKRTSQRIQRGLFSDPDLIPVFHSKYWPKEALKKIPIGQKLYACQSPFHDIVGAIRTRVKPSISCQQHQECQTISVTEWNSSRALLFDGIDVGNNFFLRSQEGLSIKDELDSESMVQKDSFQYFGSRRIVLTDLEKRAQSYNQCQKSAYLALNSMVEPSEVDADDLSVSLSVPQIRVQQRRKDFFCIQNKCREPTSSHDRDTLVIEEKEELEPGYTQKLTTTFERLFSIQRVEGLDAALQFYESQLIWTLPTPLTYRSRLHELQKARGEKIASIESQCQKLTEGLQRLSTTQPTSCRSVRDCVGLSVWDCCGNNLIGAVAKSDVVQRAIRQHADVCKQVQRPVCDCELPSAPQTYDCVEQQCVLTTVSQID